MDHAFKSFVVDFVLILFYFIYSNVDKNVIQELGLGDEGIKKQIKLILT